MELQKLGKVYRLSAIAVLFLIGTGLFSGFCLHPIHNSMANLDWNQETSALEISMRIFADDLEAAIRPEGHPALNLGLENEHVEAEDFLVNYLGEVFAAEGGGHPLDVLYVGREQKEEVTWVYLEIPEVSALKGIKIRYAVLMDLYEDQLNVLRYTVDGATKGLMFTHSDQEQWLEK